MFLIVIFLLVLVNVGAARPGSGLPMPHAIDKPIWTCADNMEFTRGQWGLNIVPWWGIPQNINTDDPYFKAFVIFYNQNEFIDGTCDTYAHPVACGAAGETYNFTAKDLGFEETIHIKMGSACLRVNERGMENHAFRQSFMDAHVGTFENTQISIGEEGIWMDVDLEVKRSRGEAAGRGGVCRKWDVPHGNLRTGAVCALPLDFQDGKIR